MGQNNSRQPREGVAYFPLPMLWLARYRRGNDAWWVEDGRRQSQDRDRATV